jgi:AraC-like DNA-binding protein
MPEHPTNLNIENKIKLWRPDSDAYELLIASGITRSMPRQISQEYMIGVIEQGQANVTYRGKSYNIDGGCFMLLHPGESFSREGSTKHPRTVRMLLAEPQFLKRQISNLKATDTELPQFKHTIDSNYKIVKAFSKIHRALENASTRLERDCWLQEIVALLLKHCIAEDAQQPLSSQESERIKLVKTLLTERFKENISLDELATHIKLSPYRLNRIFSLEVGIPPHAFLNQIRVRHAKIMLEQGVPIAETAIESGFYDQAHLTRHFKRLMGFTPGFLSNRK